MLGDTGFNITEGDEIIERLSERFYFLRYVGLAVCGKTQDQSPQGPKLDGLHGLNIEAESPAPTHRPQRRGGFSLGLARGDRSGCLRNSSAAGYSRCPLSLFPGPGGAPARPKGGFGRGGGRWAGNFLIRSALLADAAGKINA